MTAVLDVAALMGRLRDGTAQAGPGELVHDMGGVGASGSLPWPNVTEVNRRWGRVFKAEQRGRQ